MKESVLLVNTPDEFLSRLSTESLKSAYDLIPVGNTDEALQVCRRENESVVSIILGPATPDPIQASQRIFAQDQDLSVIILTSQDKLEHVRKSVSFTPFLGRLTSCFAEADTELVPSIKKMAEGTIRHRQSKVLTSRLNFEMQGNISSKANVPGHGLEYVERLLDAAPIGILTLSAEGEILALNKGALQMLSLSEAEGLKHKIGDIFPELDLAAGRPLELKRGEKFFEATLTSLKGRENEEGKLLLLSDITSRKKYEDALKSAISTRDVFLSIASHELNTPLAGLKLQIQLRRMLLNRGEMEGFSPEKLNEMLEKDERQINRLARLVEDMLDVSRISTGKLGITKTKTDVCSLTRDIVNRLTVQFKSSGNEVEFSCSPNEVYGEWDAFRLEQVLLNLLTNASKYAPGKPIKVKIEQQPQWALISIKDEGPGISEEHQLRIFDRFERAVNSSDVSGLGLGLYISKQIVEAHGGTINLESSPGKGCLFSIKLPLS